MQEFGRESFCARHDGKSLAPDGSKIFPGAAVSQPPNIIVEKPRMSLDGR